MNNLGEQIDLFATTVDVEIDESITAGLFPVVGNSDNKTDNKDTWCFECRLCGKESSYAPEKKLEAKTPRGFVDDKILGMICSECYRRERKH